jgi:hypothetical protein
VRCGSEPANFAGHTSPSLKAGDERVKGSAANARLALNTMIAIAPNKLALHEIIGSRPMVSPRSDWLR